MSPFCSLFSQILKFISRSDFEGQVRKLSAERHARGVSCWQQFVSIEYSGEDDQGFWSNVTGVSGGSAL